MAAVRSYHILDRFVLQKQVMETGPRGESGSRELSWAAHELGAEGPELLKTVKSQQLGLLGPPGDGAGEAKVLKKGKVRGCRGHSVQEK